MDVDYSSLSEKDLSQMLKDYGVSVGPINAATRRIYERKLHKLKTGKSIPDTPKYAPVPNDDDDYEVQFKPVSSVPRQTQPPTANVIHRTPEPTQPRMRRDPSDLYSPHIDSRPSLSSARKTTLSYDPHRADRVTTQASAPKEDQSQSKGLPMWVKLTALAAVIFLIYLIYTNMESNVANNIPKIPSKMEV